jgi:hypothetical protein
MHFLSLNAISCRYLLFGYQFVRLSQFVFSRLFIGPGRAPFSAAPAPCLVETTFMQRLFGRMSVGDARLFLCASGPKKRLGGFGGHPTQKDKPNVQKSRQAGCPHVFRSTPCSLHGRRRAASGQGRPIF